MKIFRVVMVIVLLVIISTNVRTPTVETIQAPLVNLSKFQHPAILNGIFFECDLNCRISAKIQDFNAFFEAYGKKCKTEHDVISATPVVEDLRNMALSGEITEYDLSIRLHQIRNILISQPCWGQK